MQLVQNTLSRFVDSGQIAGCAVRIMRKDEVCFEGSFGYANIDRKVKVKVNNATQVASTNEDDDVDETLMGVAGLI